MSGMLTVLGLPRLWRHDPDVLWQYMRAYLGPVVMGLAPTRAHGAARIPAAGGLVLAANHFSAIDHPILAAVSPRPICFVSKAELLALPVVGEALAWTGAFPVTRGKPDRTALRHARKLASAGAVIGVHLEGTRQRRNRPGEFKAGAVVIAMQAGVPIVPCGLDTFGWSIWNRRRCTVVFGEPMDLGHLRRNRDGYREGLELVGAEVRRLWRSAVAATAANSWLTSSKDESRRSTGDEGATVA